MKSTKVKKHKATIQQANHQSMVEWTSVVRCGVANSTALLELLKWDTPCRKNGISRQETGKVNRRNSYIVFVLFSNMPKTEEAKYNQDDRKYEFGRVQYRNQSGTKWDLWRPSPPLIICMQMHVFISHRNSIEQKKKGYASRSLVLGFTILNSKVTEYISYHKNI